MTMKEFFSLAEKCKRVKLLSLLALALISLAVNGADPDITFTVSMDDAANHNFRVTMTMTGLQQDYTVLKMPVWTPGYYRIQNYPKDLCCLTVKDDNGNLLAFEKTLKNAWKVSTSGVSTFTASYVVFASNHSVADPYLDSTYAFIVPAGLFLYPEGSIKASSEITIVPYDRWTTISTGLDLVEGKENTYFAPDFDVLFDSPFLIGNHEVISFDVGGIPHYIAVLEPGPYNRDSLTSDYARMVRSAVSIIGEMPYKHYTFLIMGQGGGGLEHFNSMAVFTGIYGGDIYPSERGQFLSWMSFIAHEFFHLYNVKTIRPIALGPFDYDKENYTNMLWVSEGFSVYFENIILNRAGFMSGEEMREALSSSITNYESVPGNRVQSVTMSSYDTWINFFSRSENSENTTISYYDKGCGLALLLDLKIRHETSNRKSLIDVMRTLYYDYYKGLGRGFTDDEFRKECEKTAGCSLEEIFMYVSTTIKPDYDKYLDYAGLFLKEEAPAAPGGRARFVIMKKDSLSEEQKVIYNDLFRPLGLN